MPANPTILDDDEEIIDLIEWLTINARRAHDIDAAEVIELQQAKIRRLLRYIDVVDDYFTEMRWPSFLLLSARQELDDAWFSPQAIRKRNER